MMWVTTNCKLLNVNTTSVQQMTAVVWVSIWWCITFFGEIIVFEQDNVIKRLTSFYSRFATQDTKTHFKNEKTTPTLKTTFNITMVCNWSRTTCLHLVSRKPYAWNEDTSLPRHSGHLPSSLVVRHGKLGLKLIFYNVLVESPVKTHLLKVQTPRTPSHYHKPSMGWGSYQKHHLFGQPEMQTQHHYLHRWKLSNKKVYITQYSRWNQSITSYPMFITQL